MSYCTSYDLEIRGEGAAVDKATEELALMGPDAKTAAEQGNVYSTWYTHENDILAVSIANPDVLFILNGEGEASDDVWEQRWKAGQTEVTHPIITWPAYENKNLWTENEKANN